ncbi:MAG TPA: serine/threonine-protein kinase [Thermoanaerobaculia bacterium]|nr:serine/threonine-protein kinase [Thermoanaerobaculia bacterium]
MQTFGKYEIVTKIGEGGFGVVYEAYDPRIERRVAVKTCPTDDETLRQRFLHEARISGNLHHRHIIVVYDYGEEGDVPYLVQEFLTGEDLDRKIARGDELSFDTKLEYLIQVAEGLDFAHRQGVIHRDIKPSNIRILDDGQVKIMDFGIAKLRDSEIALTLPGQTVGTPAYLAPEQIRNVEPDARCDIYSYGLVGYELLTYRKAFPSKNASRVLYQVLNEEPARIGELWPECPAEVERILERCYRKDRDQRWDRLDQVAEALRAVRDGAPAPAPPAGRTYARLQVDDSSATLVTPGGSLQLAAAPRAALDDLPLGGLGPAAPHPAATPRPLAEPAPPASRVPLVALAVIAAVVLAWLGYRWLDVRSAPATAPPAVADATPEPGVAEPEAGEREPAAPREREESPPAPVPAAAAPAAAPRATTTLVLAPAWDPTATARVGDRTPVTLDRQRSLEIPADRPVTVTFASGRPDYPQRREVVVEPGGAARRTLDFPIAAPGALTVRAGLGAPRLRVSIAGEEAGFTPVTARLLSPGSHQVRVAPETPEEGAEERTYTVDLATQEEVVLTFDLRRSGPSIARRPYRN